MKQATMEMYIRANTFMLTAILACFITAGVMGANFYKKNKDSIDKLFSAGNDLENISSLMRTGYS
tara:strand:- start:2171 stop:2365 length:195 start_codon:yes stop_codon:yes gene_type:complete